MKDSLPTAKDVRHIIYKLQRKKNVIPEHAALTNNLNADILKARELLNAAVIEADKTRFQSELSKLLKAKRDLEDLFFEDLRTRIENYILDQPTSIRLSTKIHQGRRITTFNRRRTTLTLVDRYISLVLGRAFKIRTSGRDQLLRTAINSLDITRGSNPALRTVHKVDIQDFFHSVSHEKLLRKISSHAGVPRFVQIHLRSILAAYARVHGGTNGLPQGVPSSSMLAEIYLENFDRKLRQHPKVILYLRYVDDILIVGQGHEVKELDDLVQKELGSLGLQKHPMKSKLLAHPSPNKGSFDYLGYEFSFSAGASQLVQIDLSLSKMERYLNALAKLVDFGDGISCWADPKSVDRFLGGYEYLLFPHVNAADGDAMRIVTGLAYSARLIRPRNSAPPNLNKLLMESNIGLMRRYGLFPQNAKGRRICACCSRVIHRERDFSELRDRVLRLDAVIYAAATQHLEDEVRDDVRGVLWS